MRRAGWVLWAGSCIASVVWLLYPDPDADSAPGDASRPRRRPPPQLHTEPLDSAAWERGDAVLKRMRAGWRLDSEMYAHPDRFENLHFISLCSRGYSRFSGENPELRLFALGYPRRLGWPSR